MHPLGPPATSRTRTVDGRTLTVELRDPHPNSQPGALRSRAMDVHENVDEDEEEYEDDELDARRARWTATGTGALLAFMGLAASTLRLTGTAPVLVPGAYAFGAAVCGLASVLGARGRTRRALWLLIAGVMVMALGDQFD